MKEVIAPPWSGGSQRSFGHIAMLALVMWAHARRNPGCITNTSAMHHMRSEPYLNACMIACMRAASVMLMHMRAMRTPPQAGAHAYASRATPCTCTVSPRSSTLPESLGYCAAGCWFLTRNGRVHRHGQQSEGPLAPSGGESTLPGLDPILGGAKKQGGMETWQHRKSARVSLGYVPYL